MTNYVVDGPYDWRHPSRMLGTDELLERLKHKGVRNVEIARVLDLPDSRIPEIRDRRRALKLDEAVKLVRAFELEQDGAPVQPVPQAILRLLVQYIALRLGTPEARLRSHLDELTEDMRAFSEFASDPKVRRSIEAAEGFFRAMLLRRPGAESEVEQESGPERIR